MEKEYKTKTSHCYHSVSCIIMQLLFPLSWYPCIISPYHLSSCVIAYYCPFWWNSKCGSYIHYNL